MPRRKASPGDLAGMVRPVSWAVPQAESIEEFLKNAKRVWRQQRPDSLPRRGRPSEAPLIFLACYDSTKNWEGRFTLRRLQRAVMDRLERFKTETVKSRHEFAVPHEDTLLKHIKTWLLWRSGFTVKGWDLVCNGKPLARFEIRGSLSDELKKAITGVSRLSRSSPSGYVTFLSSRGRLRPPSDYDRRTRPDFAAWIDDQVRLTGLVRNWITKHRLVR